MRSSWNPSESPVPSARMSGADAGVEAEASVGTDRHRRLLSSARASAGVSAVTRDSLAAIRRAIDAAADDGPYVVRCGQTGERPVPVGDHRFATRSAAELGAELATAYRARLRRYDPRTRLHDLIVCERPPDGLARPRVDERTPFLEVPVSDDS